MADEKTINDIQKALGENKDAHIDVLKDLLADAREHHKFARRVIYMLIASLVLLIAVIGGIGVYNQNMVRKIAEDNRTSLSSLTERFIKFVEDTEFVTFTADNQSHDNSITINGVRAGEQDGGNAGE